MFELYKEAWSVVNLAAHLQDEAASAKGGWPRNQAICAGLMIRICKFMRVVTQLSAKGDRGEVVSALNRSIMESAINLEFLVWRNVRQLARRANRKRVRAGGQYDGLARRPDGRSRLRQPIKPPLSGVRWVTTKSAWSAAFLRSHRDKVRVCSYRGSVRFCHHQRVRIDFIFRVDVLHRLILGGPRRVGL